MERIQRLCLAGILAGVAIPSLLACSSGTIGGPTEGSESKAMGDNASESMPCGGVTPQGKCEGDTFLDCKVTGNSDVVVYEATSRDCAADGLTCAWSIDSFEFGCVAKETACGDVKHDGRCEGNTVVWCDEGESLQAQPCVGGSVCDFSFEKGIFDCMQPCEGGVTSIGKCEGNTAYHCADGVLTKQECVDGGAVAECGWDKALGSYSCLWELAPGSPATCSGQTEHCDGNVLYYCALDDEMHAFDCDSFGMQCGLVEGGFMCFVPEPEPSCLANGHATSGGELCCSKKAHYSGGSLVCGPAPAEPNCIPSGNATTGGELCCSKSAQYLGSSLVCN